MQTKPNKKEFGIHCVIVKLAGHTSNSADNTLSGRVVNPLNPKSFSYFSACHEFPNSLAILPIDRRNAPFSAVLTGVNGRNGAVQFDSVCVVPAKLIRRVTARIVQKGNCQFFQIHFFPLQSNSICSK